MAFTKQASFSKKPADLPDVPSPSYTAADIKSYFETPSDELMTTVNNVVDTLNSTADGNSGADNIGATGFDGTASNIQALLNYLKANKTDLTGDHKGTWQGFTPSKADPGISSVVDQHTQKLDGIINLAEWDLHLDGVTSDRPSLVAAIALWQTIGGIIKLPKGTMYIDSAVELPLGITIEGTGLNSTILKSSATDGVFKNANDAKFITLRDFMILGPSSESTGVGLDTTHIGNSNFENLYVSGFATGIRVSNSVGNACYYNTFTAVRVESCTIGWDLNNNANAHNFMGCRAIQCVTGISLDTNSQGNTFTGTNVEVYSPLASPAYGFKFGAGAQGNLLNGCRIEITGQGESLYCTDATADYNVVLGSTIYTQTPLSGGGSFKGFSGTGGLNNSVINGQTPTVLKGVSTIDSPDAANTNLNVNLRNKTANGYGARFYGYKSDLTTLQEIFDIMTGLDSPIINILYNTILKIQNNFTVTGPGKGMTLTGPGGTTTATITIDDNAKMKAGSVYANMGLSGTTANRPTTNLYVGMPYFDTSLGKPVYCKTLSPIAWVDATGTTV